MKLSKKNIMALQALVGAGMDEEDPLESSDVRRRTPSFSSAANKKAISSAMSKDLLATAKRMNATPETLPGHSLKHILSSIYWTNKVRWPGSEADFAEVFVVTFKQQLERLRNERQLPILPGIDAMVDGPKKKRPRKPKMDLVGAQDEQDIYESIKSMNAMVSVSKRVTYKDGEANNVKTADNPKMKITDDNHLKLFTEIAPGTLLPLVDIDLAKEPVTDVVQKKNTFVIKTALGRIIMVSISTVKASFAKGGRYTTAPMFNNPSAPSVIPEDIEFVGAETASVIPGDIEEFI